MSLFIREELNLRDMCTDGQSDSYTHPPSLSKKQNQHQCLQGIFSDVKL